MGKRVRLCGKAEVAPGEMLRLDIEGQPPLAAFNVEGDFFCTSNLCTHNRAFLTDGFFDGDVVECPLHGGCFNVKTGAALQFPCEKPLRCFPVTVVGEELFADVE